MHATTIQVETLIKEHSFDRSIRYPLKIKEQNHTHTTSSATKAKTLNKVIIKVRALSDDIYFTYRVQGEMFTER